jgi:hypothetical protein
MNTIFFRSTIEVYSQLQPAIDQADREQPAPHTSFILTGHCEHILPPEPTVGIDGMAYVAVPEFLLGVNGAEDWINFEGVEQVSEATYRAAMPSGENLEP